MRCIVFYYQPRAFLASCTACYYHHYRLFLEHPQPHNSFNSLASHHALAAILYQASCSLLYPLVDKNPLPWSFTGLEPRLGLDWTGLPLVSAFFPLLTRRPLHFAHPICPFSSHFKPFHSVQFSHFHPPSLPFFSSFPLNRTAYLKIILYHLIRGLGSFHSFFSSLT